MKKLIVLVALAAIVLVGCGGSLKDKLVGAWKIDTDTISSPQLTDEVKKSPMWAELKKGMDSGRIEFKKDGTYTATGMGQEPTTGKWTLEGNNLTTTSDKPDQDKNKPALTVNAEGTKIHAKFDTQGQTMEMDFVKA